MSRATPDDQLKFFLNGVKHSNSVKIDFVEVAKECGIVSKGAAAKRYERLMKANGIHPNGRPSEKTILPTLPKEKSKAAIVRAAAAKKRKIEGDVTPTDALKNDDDGSLLFAKQKPGNCSLVKQEPIMVTSAFHTQSRRFPPAAESSSMPKFALSSSNVHFQVPPTPQNAVMESSSIFDEFCTPELF